MPMEASIRATKAATLLLTALATTTSKEQQHYQQQSEIESSTTKSSSCHFSSGNINNQLGPNIPWKLPHNSAASSHFTGNRNASNAFFALDIWATATGNVATVVAAVVAAGVAAGVSVGVDAGVAAGVAAGVDAVPLIFPNERFLVHFLPFPKSSIFLKKPLEPPFSFCNTLTYTSLSLSLSLIQLPESPDSKLTHSQAHFILPGVGKLKCCIAITLPLSLSHTHTHTYIHSLLSLSESDDAHTQTQAPERKAH